MTEPEIPPPGNCGCGTVLLVILGIVLLLPGLCSLVFIVALKSDGMRNIGNASITQLWFTTFLVAAGGIWLIVYAVRRR